MSTELDYKKYAVLYVDDEEQALKYFRKGLGKELNVLTANAVAPALEILRAEAGKIAVVITDQKMPGGTGVELLTQVRQQWPGIVRILITAYSEIENAIAAVNSGSIYKYITKPADFPNLKAVLQGAMELFLQREDRDTLLKEKADVLQRMVVADRVRSMSMLAEGISHHFRNSMTAMSCFLEEAAAGDSGGTPEAVAERATYLDDLWKLAQKEREDLIQMVQRVGQTLVAPAAPTGEVLDVQTLITQASAASAPEVAADRFTLAPLSAPVSLKGNAAALTKLLRTLFVYAARLSTAGSKVSVSIQPGLTIWNSAGIQIFVRGSGVWNDKDVAGFFTPFAFPANDPSDLGLDMTAAFAAAYQHAGDLLVHQKAPEGPGFELRLPLDPSAVQRPAIQDGLMHKLTGQLAPGNITQSAA